MSTSAPAFINQQYVLTLHSLDMFLTDSSQHNINATQQVNNGF